MSKGLLGALVCLPLLTTPALAQVGLVDVIEDVDAAAWAGQAPTLEYGDRGGAVGLLQTLLGDALAAKGLPRPAVDNAFGPQTRAAVKRLQKQVDLPPSGVADADLWTALREALPHHPLGELAPFAGEPVGPAYKRNNSGSANIRPRRLAPPGKPALVYYESKMAIDADGAGGAWKSDPWGQPETSLRYPDGRSLNPSTLSFAVLPGGFAKKVPGLRLGDVVAVIYRGRVAYAIYGDVGPKTKIGEGSIHLARSLGIDADPKSGGTSGGVLYLVFPGSGDGTPLPQDEIDRRGAELLRDAGGRP